MGVKKNFLGAGEETKLSGRKFNWILLVLNIIHINVLISDV